MYAKKILLTIATVGLLAAAGSAQADTTNIFLDGSTNATGDYAGTASWSLGNVPNGATEDAYFKAGNTATLASDVTAFVPRTLYIGEIGGGTATSGEIDVSAAEIRPPGGLRPGLLVQARSTKPAAP